MPGPRGAVERKTPVPLYHQIATVLRDRIADNVYPGGAVFPSEDELQTEFGVSRGTIRQAVNEIRQAGLVERQQGVGTFVSASARTRLGQRFRGSLADLMTETRRARVKTVDLDRAAVVPQRIAERLRIDGTTATRLTRTRTMDGRVFAYTVNYLPAEFGQLLDEQELRTTSLMWLLEQKGVALVGAEQSIRAQPASLDVSQRLGLPVGEPLLFVERLVLTTGSRPVELVQTWYRGDVYEYTVTFDLKPDEGGDVHAQLA